MDTEIWYELHYCMYERLPTYTFVCICTLLFSLLCLKQSWIVTLKWICTNESFLPKDSDFQSIYANIIALYSYLFIIMWVFTVCTSAAIFILPSMSLMTILDRIKTKTVLLKISFLRPMWLCLSQIYWRSNNLFLNIANSANSAL